jgi:hypothetical protein
VSNHDNFNLTDPAELERLSLDELNAILDGDFASDDRISTDTILLVLEEIEKRVGNTPSPTLDAAWETIKKEHLRPAAQGAEAEHETDIEYVQSIKPKTSKPQKILPRIVGIAAAVVIVIFAAGSLIPAANGSNLWSAFVEWTKEAFGYSKTVEEKRGEIPEQLQELKKLMESYIISASELLPSYIPDGYEATTTFCDEQENATIFFCALENENNSIVLQYRLLKNGEATTEYQKNDDAVEEYTVDGSNDMFYIVGNLDLYTVTWSDGNMECSIQNVPSHEELIKMIDSIYEGN